MKMRRGIPRVFALCLGFLLAFPAFVPAHGSEEQGGRAGEPAVEQPARVLAQQAISLMLVSGDVEEAAMLLDQAVEAEDKTNVDPELLNQAMETFDAGSEEDAISLLDQALSKPLGEESGVALHDSGREFEPATGAQEDLAIVAGGILLLLAGFLLLRGRRAGAA